MDLQARELVLGTLRVRGVALSGELCDVAKESRIGVGRLYETLRELEADRVIGSRTIGRAPKRVVWWIWGRR